MRVLVSGGFGFLGTSVIEALIENYGSDISIHVVDNLSSNPIPHEVFLDEIERPDNFTFDVVDIHEFCETTDDTDWDVIYHLASVVGPAGVLGHAGRIAYTINRDARLLAELALKSDAKLVDISTSEIYGGGRDGQCKEEYPRVITADYSVRLEYAAGKLASEIALVNMAATAGLKTSIIRPFNIAGPRQSGKGGFVLPRFIGQAMTGRPITVFGDGSQIRAFTHVRDMASGIILAAEKGKNGEAYNLGNIKNKTTILELAEAVKAVVNPAAEIVFIDPKTDYGPLYEEANDKYPDATLAMKELGWEPKYLRDDVIRHATEYMKTLDSGLLQTLAGAE